MRRLSLILTTLLTLAAAGNVQASERKYGIGFVLGNPTALSGRYNMAKDKALDLQFAFDSGNWILFYGDYLIKFPGVFNSHEEFIEALTPYAGIGPVAAIGQGKDHDRGDYFDKRSDSFALAVRIPFGIEWMNPNPKMPIGIGLELAPGIVIVPRTDGFLHGGVTFRYYF